MMGKLLFKKLSINPNKLVAKTIN